MLYLLHSIASGDDKCDATVEAAGPAKQYDKTISIPFALSPDHEHTGRPATGVMCGVLARGLHVTDLQLGHIVKSISEPLSKPKVKGEGPAAIP